MGDNYSLKEKMDRVEELLTRVGLHLVQINKNALSTFNHLFKY